MLWKKIQKTKKQKTKKKKMNFKKLRFLKKSLRGVLIPYLGYLHTQFGINRATRLGLSLYTEKFTDKLFVLLLLVTDYSWNQCSFQFHVLILCWNLQFVHKVVLFKNIFKALWLLILTLWNLNLLQGALKDLIKCT